MTDLTKEAVEAALAGATPGPWEYEGDLNIGAPSDDNEPWHVAIATECCGHPVDQSEANARLIAMAPDLARAYLDLTAENERLRDQAVRACVLSGQDLAEGDWGPEGRNMAVMIEERVRAAFGVGE